jgi:hypothetical protein
MSNKEKSGLCLFTGNNTQNHTRNTMPMLIMAPLTAAAIFVAGCQTTDSTGHRVVDPVKTEKVARVLEATVTSGVLMGIQKQPKVAGYLQAVGSLACSFSQGTDLSPEALNIALQTTTIREFKTVEAQLIVNTIVTAYALAYADRANADVEANIYAKTIMDVLCKGLHNGVEQAKAQGLISAAR